MFYNKVLVADCMHDHLEMHLIVELCQTLSLCKTSTRKSYRASEQNTQSIELCKWSHCVIHQSIYRNSVQCAL